MDKTNITFKQKDVYGIKISYKDDLDLIKKVLTIFASLTNLNKEENYLRPRLIEVLSFYILMDFNKETKNMIIESLDINNTNLNQINSELGRKGYLIRDSRNMRNYHLSDDLKMLKEYFIKQQTANAFLIPLKKSKKYK